MLVAGLMILLASCHSTPKTSALTEGTSTPQAADTARILTFYYTLTNTAGEVLDQSEEGHPLPVLEGAEQIIPGLETELFKMKAGEKKRIVVPAEEAYGPVYEDRKIKVAKKDLPPEALKVGTPLSTGMPYGPIFVVTSIEGDEVLLDGNHPLAGEDLTFDVEVVEIRTSAS